MNTHAPLMKLKDSKKSCDGVVVCIPGAGDGIASFISLSSNLPESMTVFGMQARGLDEDEHPYESINEMVGIYGSEILSAFKDKKIYLIGHSFGGLVAIELANQFKNGSVELGTLVLLDVTPPQESGLAMSEADRLVELIEVMEMSSQFKFNISSATLESLDRSDQLILIHRKMVEAKLMPKNSEANAIGGMVRVFLKNAEVKYLPSEQYTNAAILINAEESKQTSEQRKVELDKWAQYIPNLGYAESKGNHMTLLNPINSVALANIIKESWV